MRHLEGMMSLIERLNNEETIPLEDVPALVNEFTTELARMQATLTEKDVEIVKLKHELKQDEYKFIRNHDDYHKELGGLREQLTEKDVEIARLKGLFADANNDDVLVKQSAIIEQLQIDLDRVRQRKDAAYRERNQVVAALAKVFPSGIMKTAIEGWDEEWYGCVYIDLPTGQVSWHYHNSHAYLFEGLPAYIKRWDGHTTEEKYQRLEALESVELDRVVGEKPS